MPREKIKLSLSRTRRQYTDEFKQEAVQLHLDGHSAASVVERLGLSSVNLLDRWKRELVCLGGVAAEFLNGRVRELEEELRRVQQERDILVKCLLACLGYFQPQWIAEVCEVIDTIIQEEAFATSQMCEVLSVSRPGYFRDTLLSQRRCHTCHLESSLTLFQL